MKPLRLALAAAIVLASFQRALAGGLEAPAVGHGFVLVGGLVLLFAGLGFWGAVTRFGLQATLERAVLVALGVPLTWMLLAGSRALTGFPPWGLMFPLWVVLVVVVLRAGGGLVPGPVRRLWSSLFTATVRETHGSAHFGTARNAARHLAPAAPADAFVLGVMRDAPRGADRRFRQDGHLLTCAPTGAGKGISGVIPNLLEYPGSAFVLDFKGETYAVSALAICCQVTRRLRASAIASKWATTSRRWADGAVTPSSRSGSRALRRSDTLRLSVLGILVRCPWLSVFSHTLNVFSHVFSVLTPC